MPFLRAIHARRRIRTALARHECGAAMLADGYYRVTRSPAALAITAGPGVCNAVTGIALAHSEQTPMIVLSAQVPTHWLGRGAAQEMDTVQLLRPVTKESIALADPSRAQSALEHLIGVATSGRPGPVHLSVPLNAWSLPTVDQPAARRVLLPAPDPEAMLSVSRLLRAAESPCVLVGYGAVQAGAERELAALAAAHPKLRVACTPRAKGAFAEEHPQSLGVFGFAGQDAATSALLGNSDLLLVLGSRLGEMTTHAWDRRLGQRRMIQVDIEASELGRNYPIELGVVCDVRQFLLTLLDGAGESRVSSSRFASVELCPEPSPRALSLPGEELAPSRLMSTLNRHLRGDEHVFVDIGNCMAWSIHYLVRNCPRRWHLNLVFGCMGHALPAAVGGALGGSKRNVVIVGDSAFAMSGFELHTAVELRLPIVVIVLNDSGHGMVEMGCDVQFGPGKMPSYRFGRRLALAEFAASLGAGSFEVKNEAELECALDAAFRFDGPVLLDVRIDPTEMPPFGARMSALKRNFGVEHSQRGAND